MPSGRVERQAQFQALVASTSELTTVGRDLRRLAALLGRGEVAEAARYRVLLDSVADDVRRHVELASGVLAEVHGTHQRAEAVPRTSSRRTS